MTESGAGPAEEPLDLQQLAALVLSQPDVIKHLGPLHGDDGYGNCSSCAAEGKSADYRCKARKQIEEAARDGLGVTINVIAQVAGRTGAAS